MIAAMICYTRKAQKTTEATGCRSALGLGALRAVKARGSALSPALKFGATFTPDESAQKKAVAGGRP